jgi:Zn-dependent peptidase ImmA (M78 family)
LLKNNVVCLPVNPFSIALKNGWQILTYSRFAAIIDKSIDYLTSCYDKNGFVFWSNAKQTFIICYNPACPADVVRWTLIHEIGHIVLRHITNKNPLMRRNGSDSFFF